MPLSLILPAYTGKTPLRLHPSPCGIMVPRTCWRHTASWCRCGLSSPRHDLLCHMYTALFRPSGPWWKPCCLTDHMRIGLCYPHRLSSWSCFLHSHTDRIPSNRQASWCLRCVPSRQAHSGFCSCCRPLRRWYSPVHHTQAPVWRRLWSGNVSCPLQGYRRTQSPCPCRLSGAGDALPYRMYFSGLYSRRVL